MADRDTTLPPEIERALHNLVHDRRGTTTWNAARIIIAAALREAREGAEREWHAQADRAMALYAKAKAAESERDALAARVEGLKKSVRGFHDFGEGLSQPFGGRSKHIIMAGEVLIGMAQKALAASPSPSSGRAPVAPARAPYYLADGSAILLPREEVERLRRAAAKVIGAARELVEAAWDGDVAPGQGAWWGVNDGDFQPLANALDMLDTNDGDRAPVAPEGRETGAGGDIGPCACEQVSVIGSFVTTVDGVTHRRSTYCGPPPGVRAPAPETPAPEGTDAPRSLPVEGGHKLRANSGGSR
jgi:hypothetical protein